ncbi:hypothetical protein BYT27DRAFT_7265536 [Phlegmacium glaucopus]|nr:hypothetical protein BYT27DRAFT_7265536 [Phlegmacium glaucopus]
MSTTPRFIIVDDVDSEIQYTGPWFRDEGSLDDSLLNGPTYLGTLHGTKSNASLSFTFNGTQFKVLGTLNTRIDSGVADPTWQCFIDDISIDPHTPGPSPSDVSVINAPSNNWVLCEHDMLLDGPHIITVNATVLKNQPFWIDNIQYVPSTSVSLDQAVVVVDNLDPQLQYGPGWQGFVFTNMTTFAGSMLTFNFIGVSLSWYGVIFPGYSVNSSPATYSIDGQTPTTFLLRGLPVDYNLKFFETSPLTAGPHTLKVVYEGTNSTPLTLDYLIIQNGTLPSTTTSVSSDATSVSSDATSSTTGNGTSGASTSMKGSTPVGTITGGVIGGIALIVLAIVGLLLLRRHQKRATQKKANWHWLQNPGPGLG